MNERIIELANEANKDIGYTFKMEEAKQLHELMEKFAELIVDECLSICEELGDKGMDGHYCADAISKTFRTITFRNEE